MNFLTSDYIVAHININIFYEKVCVQAMSSFPNVLDLHKHDFYLEIKNS